MYRELFSIRFTHEYFGENQPLKFHCKLSSASTNLSTSMDAVLVVDDHGLKFVWNEAKFEKAECLKLFKEDCLVIYLYPPNTSEFLNITAQLPLHDKRETTVDGKVKRLAIPNIHLIRLRDGTNTELSLKSLPIDALLSINHIDEVQALKIDVHGNKEKTKSKPSKKAIKPKPEVVPIKKARPDEEVSTLYSVAKQRSTFVAVIPIARLSPSESNNFNLSFQARSVFYKYYFPSLSAALPLEIKPESDSAEEEQISFQKADPYVSQGMEVPTFVSEKPVKLRRKPLHSYKLVSAVNGVEETVIDTLPWPNTSSYYTHHDSQRGPITVLEAFIN